MLLDHKKMGSVGLVRCSVRIFTPSSDCPTDIPLNKEHNIIERITSAGSKISFYIQNFFILRVMCDNYYRGVDILLSSFRSCILMSCVLVHCGCRADLLKKARDLSLSALHYTHNV